MKVTKKNMLVGFFSLVGLLGLVGCVIFGSGSLTGEDNNNNGVRDDVDEYIIRLGDHPKQKNALHQLALSYEEIIEMNPLLLSPGVFEAIPLDNRVRLSGLPLIINNNSLAIGCVSEVYGTNAKIKLEEIRKRTFNTKIRKERFKDWEDMISKSKVSLSTESNCKHT